MASAVYLPTRSTMSAGSGSCVASLESHSSVSLNFRWFGLSAISRKDAVARLVELQPVKGDRQVILRDLLVAPVVAGLSFIDAVKTREPPRSIAHCRRAAWQWRLLRSSGRPLTGAPPESASMSMS